MLVCPANPKLGCGAVCLSLRVIRRIHNSFTTVFVSCFKDNSRFSKIHIMQKQKSAIKVLQEVEVMAY